MPQPSSLADELFAAAGLESNPTPAAPNPTPTPQPQPSAEAVTGTVATTFAPKAHLPAEKGLGDKLFAEIGIPRSTPVPLIDPATAQRAQAGKGLGDQILEQATAPPAVLKGNDPATYSQPKVKSDKGFSGLGKMALTALSIDEHLIVKGISKAQGMPEKSDLSQYTWGNYLKEKGLPDTVGTDAIGLSMAIFLSPTSYLSFGTSGILKLAKGVTLTKRGMKLANAVIEERVEKEIAELALTKEVTDQVRNRIVEKTTKEVNEELISKFRGVKSDVDQIKMGEDVSKLSNTIFDHGGINLSVPFAEKAFGKVNLIKGEEIAKIVDSTGLSKVTAAAMKAGGKTAEKVVEGIAESAPVQAFKEKIIDPWRLEFQLAKDAIGNRVIPNYGKPKELLDLAEATEQLGREKKVQIEKITQKFFGGLDPNQQKEFMDVAIKASLQKEKTQVSTLAKDEKVKDLLDKFYGQGRYEGKRSIADTLAKWSELVEDKKLANWIPGIQKTMGMGDVTLKRALEPAERAFLKQRVGDPNTYTRNPVQALSVRLAQISYAKLQDKMYENAIKTGMGGLKTADQLSKLSDVEKLSYVPFRSPIGKYLVGDADLAARGKEPLYYVTRDFAKAFEETVTKQNTRIPFLTPANNLLKASLTLTFPAFFARNFRSNIVFNAHSIGLQAMNPRRNKWAHDMVRGANLDKRIVSETGEAFTLKDIAQEMKVMNVTRGGDIFFDIAGEGIKNPAAKNRWEWMLTRANPLSSQFSPFVAGGKLNNAIENQARAVNYLTWRMRGAPAKIAAQEATDALLDYQKISQFEKKYANVIIPFYTFRRKNIEHHIKLIAHRPLFGEAYLKLFRDLGPTDEEWDGLPDWAKNRAWARIKGTMVGGWGLPIEDLFDTIPADARQLLTQTNPLLRFPAERITGIDFYTGRKLESIGSANEFKLIVQGLESPNVPPSVKSVLKRLNSTLKLKRDPSNEEKIIGDPFALHVARNLWTARWQSTLGLMQNPDKTFLQVALQWGLGILTLTPDEEKQISIERQKSGRKIGSKLVEKGVAYELPLVISKDKANSRYVNEIFRNLRKAGSVQEVRDIEKEAMDLGEELEQEILP